MEAGKWSTDRCSFRLLLVELATLLIEPLLVLGGFDIGAAPGKRREGVAVWVAEGGEFPARDVARDGVRDGVRGRCCMRLSLVCSLAISGRAVARSVLSRPYVDAMLAVLGRLRSSSEISKTGSMPRWGPRSRDAEAGICSDPCEDTLPAS